jgi:hypothetical protein
MTDDLMICHCVNSKETKETAINLLVEVFKEKNCLTSAYGVAMCMQILLNGMILRSEPDGEAQQMIVALGINSMDNIYLEPHEVQKLYRELIQTCKESSVREIAERALAATAEVGQSNAAN